MDKQCDIKVTQLGENGIEDLELHKTYIVIGELHMSKFGGLEEAVRNRVLHRTFYDIPYVKTTVSHVQENEQSEKDIELVMAQARCSRNEAIQMLKKHNGDIVDSIMELTECRRM